MIKRFIFTLHLLVLPILAISQSITVKVENKPLSEVFYQMRDEYQIQFAFNSKNLKNCIVTKSKTYQTPEEAIQDLTKEFDLTYKKEGNLFVILPAEIEPKQTKPEIIYYLFSGKIIDSQTKETLPSAVIKYAKNYQTTDATGFFSFKSTDSIVQIDIRYLGYILKDTTILASNFHTIELQSSEINLNEVVVTAKPQIFDMHTGQQAANIKLNHKISRFLPGNIDNGIYNMLRLQAGIMAAGEQTNDYTIWGSYQGQNLIQYDNIKLFNISTFNENQSIVHPLMIKEIDIYKGGFVADYGNVVGGVVDITGKTGDFEYFKANANINNQAASGYLNIPIANRFSLQTAYRQTFDDFINMDFDFKKSKNDIDYYTNDISFRDYNIKFSGKINKKNNFYLNFLTSNDLFQYDYSDTSKGNYNERNAKTANQTGASFVFNKFYKTGGHSTTVLSYSQLGVENDLSINYTNPEDIAEKSYVHSAIFNEINEFSAKNSYFFPAKGIHKLSVSGEFVRNETFYQNDTNYFNVKKYGNAANRFGVYAKDNISLFGKINIEAGLRADYLSGSNNIYFQPRLNAGLDLTKNIRLNAAYGKYYQFLNKRAVFDNSGLAFSLWEIIETEIQEPTSGHHYILGLNSGFNALKLNIEGFYKTIDNIYAYSFDNETKYLQQITGKSKIAGMDFYFKTQFRKHEIEVTYTLNQILESFNNQNNTEYLLAPHNQTHELKSALILNFSPFYFSSVYVYGSGLEFTRNTKTTNPMPYNRFDISAMYKTTIKQVYCQFGLSVLNTFNTYNIQHQNTINLLDGKSIYSRSMPFSVLLNLYIGF